MEKPDKLGAEPESHFKKSGRPGAGPPLSVLRLLVFNIMPDPVYRSFQQLQGRRI
jgi:hypothetical protein